MIKYELKRIPKVDGFAMMNFKYKTINKSEAEKLINEGWVLHRKKYFIITYLFDSWHNLNTDQKINVIAIITASFIGIIALI